MKRFLKIAVPVLLMLTILCSIGWYFLEYDTTFTKDFLLEHARKQEAAGNHKLSVWLYNLAYDHHSASDDIAIELAQQYKAIGNYTKAEQTLAKAIEDGGTLALYIALSQTYVEQNKLRDAVLMLDKVSDGTLKAQLDALRPAAPQADFASGTYMQYISVSFSAEGTLYVNANSDYPSVATDAYTTPIRLMDGQTTMFAVSVDESGLVSPLSIYHYVVGGVVEEVMFADPAFEAAVREALEVDENYVIYTNMLWDLKAFTVPTEVKTCADLKWIPYLETLVIDRASFEDLTILKELSSLKSLSIIGAPIPERDLQTIAELPLLQELTLQDCGISSISTLAGCTDLTYLDLSNNAIRDISHLSSLLNLRYLSLRGNAVIDPQALSTLTQLEVLDLAYNSLTTTQPLSALINLTQLDVSANDLHNTAFLGLDALVNLRHFSATHNNLVDVSILSACTMLETLDVSYNTLLNINVAAKLKNLVTLNFSNNEVTSLPKFDTTCALQVIDGSYNAITSLKSLSKLENLTHVYMDYADYHTHDSADRLTSVDTLQDCPNLVEVHVYGTKVRDVSKLTKKGILVLYTPL